MRRALALGALALPAALGAQRGGVDSLFAAYGRAAPGCAVGVSERGRVTLERAYGMADLEHGVPNTPATIFEAGSVSKQVTAGAVVLLALDGRLSLDDDVRKHVPELPDYGAPITIRHLLSHTSGLRDWGSVAAIGGWPRGTRVYTNDLALGIIARQRALNYPPGERYSYTNSGYTLLATIVARVSGTTLAEFTRRRFFEPLGMTSTSWRDDFRRVVPGRALAYEPAAGGFRLDMPFEDTHGHAALLTTPADLLKWTANLDAGATVGGAGFAEAMHRRAVLTGGRTITYASGVQVQTWRGVPEVAHSGSTAGYRAYLARYPRQGVGVAVLCNHGGANATALAHGVAAAYLGSALAPAAAGSPAAADAPRDSLPLRPLGTPPSTARLAEYAGTYASDEADATLVVDVDGGALRVRHADGRVAGRFPATFEDAFGPAGAVRFVRDSAGRVTALSVREARVWDMRFARR